MNSLVETCIGTAASLPPGVLAELQAFRGRVFADGLRWQEELGGRDRYDDFHPVYVVARRAGRVVGCLRLMPTEGPCMAHDVFPHLLDADAVRRGPEVWEVSRFAAVPDEEAFAGQGTCPETARALVAHALDWGRVHRISRLVGVATEPLLAFAVALGLAPRRSVPASRGMPEDDAPLAFTLGIADVFARDEQHFPSPE